MAPLAAPSVGTPPERMLDYPAVELFVLRVAAVRREGHPDADDLAALARIVVELDGMPLAIELAAARALALSPAEVVDRLADRFGLLRGDFSDSLTACCQ